MKTPSALMVILFALTSAATALPPPAAYFSLDDAGGRIQDAVSGDFFPVPPSVAFRSGGVRGSYLSFVRQEGACVPVGRKYGYSEEFSLSFWLRTAPGYHDTGAIFLGRHAAGWTNGYWFMMNAEWGYGATDKLTFYYSNATAVSRTSLNDGRWHHVGAVYKKGEGGYLYIDGVLEAKGPPAQMVVPDVDFVLGGISWDKPRGAFTGDLDELSIFGQALDGADIASIAKNPGWAPVGVGGLSGKHPAPGQSSTILKIVLRTGQVVSFPVSEIASMEFED